MHKFSAALMGPALAMAMSPIPVVIALVLLVHNDRPRASSIAYLLGRATALTVSALAGTGASSLFVNASKHLPWWTDLVAVAIGAALIVAGIRSWRHQDGTDADPRWHRQVGGIHPPTAVAIGFFPPLVNPKVLAASTVAGTYIAATTSTVAATAALACYVTVATSTIAAPVLIYLFAGSRIDPRFERLRAWIAIRQNETTAVTLIAIGLAILAYALL